MESPCYNVEKKIDCPRRRAGCAVDCPEWAKYVKARDAEYVERRREKDADSVLAAGCHRRSTEYKRSLVHERARGNKR